MRSPKRFGQVVLPLALALAIIATSVYCTVDDKFSELPLDEFEEDVFDYEDDSEIDFPKHEIVAQHPHHYEHGDAHKAPSHPPPPAYHQQNNYVHPPNYSQASYVPPPPSHSQASYAPSPPVYHPLPTPVESYGEQVTYNPVPVPNYSNQVDLSYQIDTPASYHAPLVPIYPPPQALNYAIPFQQTLTATPNYQQSHQQQSYQQPAQVYEPIQPYVQPAVQPAVQPYVQPAVQYQQPAQVQKPAQVYQAPVQVQQPVQSYQEQAQQTYKPVQQVPSYQQPQKGYQQPANYSTVVVPVAPIAAPITRYSFSQLVPFIPLAGYRGNHPSLFYYRAAPYRQCPKHVYLNGPGYADIEAAFHYAHGVLNQARGVGIQYMNGSQPSWAARHQVFSFLSQSSARMDEEGLLVEIVSQYLSDRACLTKWDKQRYLPQLTKLISTSHFPGSHSCSNYYQLQSEWQHGGLKSCIASKYRTFDGFCNNPYHPYWGKSNVCHIRLLSPDYADGISLPRVSYNPRFPLPNPRVVSSYIHNDIPLEGPYNLMKMQWGQFINHDITNTALSSYDGLVDCCKNPHVRGCWPIYIPPGDQFYSKHNVTCLNFIRSGVCPTCQLGPRQQFNKNTAFLDASHVYGNTPEQAVQLRVFKFGLLKSSTTPKSGEELLPINTQEQCSGTCFLAGDTRVNQHPALTALHVLLLRNHNHHARQLAFVHPDWNDELLYQEARRLNIAEFQMITYAEYLPIVFGPILSAYYRLTPQRSGYTQFEPKADPTTWNEYVTASCRFGHSQISSTFGLYSRLLGYGQQRDPKHDSTFRLKEWFLRPSFLSDGLTKNIIYGLLGSPSQAVDPWVTDDVRNHLYQSHKEVSGGDLPATNIWRGRDHGIPGYVHYVEYCFNYKVRGWKDLGLFIPPQVLGQLRKLYKVVENIDLFTGGMAERHFPGADTGPTFACINGIQYYALKYGDRYYFEHGGQAGSFNPHQLEEIKKTSLAKLLCRTGYLQQVPAYAFLQPSLYNPVVNCSHIGGLNYKLF